MFLLETLDLKSKFHKICMLNRTPTFTIMVAGKSGLGKTTFLNTFLNKSIDKPSTINIYTLDLSTEGMLKRITAIDTPGIFLHENLGKNKEEFKNTMGCESGRNNEPRLEDVKFNEKKDENKELHSIKSSEFIEQSLNLTNAKNTLLDFIKLQYDSFLYEESKVNRSSIVDTRIHCLLYFVSPNTRGFTEYDVSFLKEASELINVILVIGKSDALKGDERKITRDKIKKQVKEYGIKLFEIEENLNPFCVIGSKTRKREYFYGTVETDNTSHSDFQALKEILLGKYVQKLIDKTNYCLYESYRTKVLEAIIPLKQ